MTLLWEWARNAGGVIVIVAGFVGVLWILALFADAAYAAVVDHVCRMLRITELLHAFAKKEMVPKWNARQEARLRGRKR